MLVNFPGFQGAAFSALGGLHLALAGDLTLRGNDPLPPGPPQLITATGEEMEHDCLGVQGAEQDEASRTLVLGPWDSGSARGRGCSVIPCSLAFVSPDSAQIRE